MSSSLEELLFELLSRFSLFFLSLFVIVYSSLRVVQQEKNNSTETSEVQTLTWYHVITFPILCSAMLLILFYFFEYIQFIFSLFTICISALTIYLFMYPFLEQCNNKLNNNNIICTTNCTNILSIVFAVFITLLWVFTGHWLLLDALGIAVATLMIQFIRLPSLKLAAVFLCLLLLYDVFWVFISSYIFNANVMVEVSTKKAKSPVAMVADKLNMHSVAQSQPMLHLPGKLIIPNSYYESNYSMLGLGDIVLPGLLVCLAIRFDQLNQLSTSSHTKLQLTCTKQSYFSLTLIGYAIGLIAAGIMVELIHYPQPALLYLVPGVLIPLVVKSLIQGQFGLLWNGPFAESFNKLIV